MQQSRVSYNQALNKILTPQTESDELVAGVVGFSGITTMFDKPRPKLGLTCPDCGMLVDHVCSEKDHVTGELKKLGVCSSRECLKYLNENRKKPNYWTPGDQKNEASVWINFCHLNSIGDTFHSLRYENLPNSSTKRIVDRFIADPTGVWVLSGNRGAGKTYDALCICEKFIREQPCCMFITEYRLSREWLKARDKGEEVHFIEQVERKKLLVVDDIGQGGLTDGFTRMLREIIDQRKQWSDRPTIFTTNYNFEDLKGVMDASFVDRIETKNFVAYNRPSRRK